MTAEPEVSVWDLAALDMVVREAGGAFTNLAAPRVLMAAAPWRPTGYCTKPFSTD
jgi:histidinol-phosphatase